MPKVLIADDEPAIVMAVCDELKFEGFDAESAATGPSAIDAVRVFRPDVVLLDLMMPGMNGFEVCRALRVTNPDLWIIILTVRGQEADRITGFEAGADDYVTKPFSLRELVGRIRVGLRRATGRGRNRIDSFGSVEVDFPARRVTKGGEIVDLTPKEFEILALLLKRAGEVVTRDDFLDAIWGKDINVTHRTVDTHIAALRKKIETEADAPAHIVGVRGIGYRLERTLPES
jgi:DNA-binding response OmpR family regulator